MKMQIWLAGVASTIAVAAVIWAWRVLNWVWLMPKRLEKFLKQQGLSGTPYQLFFGDANRRVKMIGEAKSRPIKLTDDISARVLPFISQIVEHYGKSSYLWNGPVPKVIVMEPDRIKEVFNNVYHFRKAPPNPLVRLLATGVGNYDGAKWAKHRKILNPAFHIEKLKGMAPAFYRSCSDMVRKWDDLASNAGLSCELDVWPYLASMTRDVISRTAFGSSYEEGKRIFELQDELGGLAMQAARMVYIPGWSYVPTKRNRRMKQIDREIRSKLRWIVDKKEKALKAGKAQNDDLLGILLESNSEQVEGRKLSVEDVINECKQFYLAGQETTSVLLTWTMVLLSQHQNWQARARDEVLQVLGHKRPDFDGLSHLKIVTMTLYEALRLYPPLVMSFRTVHKEVKLGDVTLPAGVNLTIPALLIHRSPQLWGTDANDFRPDRFAEGGSKATKNQHSFLPFGWGPRMCIGQNFALLEAKMALALILRRFRFKLSPSYAHAPHSAVSLHPQFGVHLILDKRL